MSDDFKESLSETCPRCHNTMEKGLLTTEYRQNMLGFGGASSNIYFTKEVKVGFFGKPKGGDDVTGRDIGPSYLAIPALRCTACEVIMFEY
jgi:hypothetical protein